jgi:hypothetical protein
MSAHSKVRGNDSEGGKKTLRVACRLEPSHHTLSQSCWLMRIFRAVVPILLLLVFDTRQNNVLRGVVAPQFVGNDYTGHIPQAL